MYTNYLSFSTLVWVVVSLSTSAEFSDSFSLLFSLLTSFFEIWKKKTIIPLWFKLKQSSNSTASQVHLLFCPTVFQLGGGVADYVYLQYRFVPAKFWKPLARLFSLGNQFYDWHLTSCQAALLIFFEGWEKYRFLLKLACLLLPFFVVT